MYVYPISLEPLMFLNADLKKKPSLADSSVLAEGYLH